MKRLALPAAVLLGAMAGTDARDGATAGARVAADYRAFLQADALEGTRIGVMRNFFGFDRRVDALMEATIEAIEQAGATIVDKANLPTRGQFGEAERLVLHYEFKDGLQKYLAALGPAAPMKSLADVIAFNDAHAKEEMPHFGQDILVAAEAKGPLTDKEYLEAKAKARRLSRDEGLDTVIGEHRLDAIIAPSGGPAWLTDLINGDSGTGGSSGPAAVAGYPSVTVPMAFVRGLPVGVSFIGKAWSEGPLLGMAYAYEQRTKARRAPEYLPSAPV